jgi:hypothetical protein
VHVSKREAKVGMGKKAVIVGVLERGGQIHAEVVETRKRHKLQQIVNEHVLPETSVYTDKLRNFATLSASSVPGIMKSALHRVQLMGKYEPIFASGTIRAAPQSLHVICTALISPNSRKHFLSIVTSVSVCEWIVLVCSLSRVSPHPAWL